MSSELPKLPRAKLHRVFVDKNGLSDYSICTSVELYVYDDTSLEEMYLWLCDNTKHQFDLVFFSPIAHTNEKYLYRILAWFENKTDATLFKLNWKSS